MKHLCVALLCLVVVSAASALDVAKVNFNEPKNLAAKGVKAKASLVVPDKTVYAWSSRDKTVSNGIVSFSLAAPDKLISVHPVANSAYAGCYANGKYYFDRYRSYTENGQSTWAHIAFSSIDLATGSITDIKDWKDEYFVINDMTYDYSTNTIYAMARNIYIDDFLTSFYFEYSCIMSINPTTGVFNEVKQFIDWSSGTLGNLTYYNLACDLNGTLYSVDASGYLVSFDPKNDFEETVIGPTGLNPAHTTQSMEFDHTTGTLYWCADYSDKVSELVVLDTTTGRASVVGPTGSDAHLVGLYIPFNVPSQAAPAAVSNFKATPDAGGAKKINLSWTNPTKSFGGYNLASISSVKILRNETLIHTLTGANPGGEMSWEDTSVADAGLYSYSVVPVNSAGDGLPSGLTRWVGMDVPAGVNRLGIGRADDGSAYLEWEAPTEGLHGGKIDVSTLGYKIIRYPDGTIIASDWKENGYTDSSLPGVGRYYYTVESHTADGVGDAVNSVEIALGSGIDKYPWTCMFSDMSEFGLWTVVNNNGGSTWKWKSRTAGGYNAQAMYEYDNNNVGDDYLISPDMYFEKGARYKVKFAYAGSNEYHTEKMEFTFGMGKTAEEQTEVLQSFTMKDGTFRFCEIDLPEIVDSGFYNFAFHAISDPGQYNIYVTDVTVTQTVAAPDQPGEEYVFEAPANLRASVDNEKASVTLTWNESAQPGTTPSSTNINEDFESMPNWQINPAGNYGWSYIDGDGGIPYVDDYVDMPYPTDGMPLAAMVMAPYELHEYVYEPNPPHSGNKYLLFKSNFYDSERKRPAPTPDDWFISPALNFDSDFIFRFYCKADPDAESPFGDLWNTEEFRVGYSTTDAQPESFKWMTDENERVTTSFNEWTKKEYSMPKDAKYVCIHYCTRNNGYWFMVDDVFIGIESHAAAAVKRAAEATFQYYEILIDDVVAGTTIETSYTVENVATGTHAAKVVAVYKEGRSDAAVTSFVMMSSGIDAVDTAIKVYPNPASERVYFGTEVIVAGLYSQSGALVAKAEKVSSMELDGIAPGLYILKLDVAAGVAPKVVKLVVR